MSSNNNPFKKIIDKSNDTQKKWEAANKDGAVVTKACTSCGAPRPKKTDLTTCAFCGFKFMTIDIEIKNE